MPGPDYPDFTQLSALRETDGVLLTNRTVNDGGSVGPLDTSTYQTVSISASPASAIVGTRCFLDLSWQSADGSWQYDEMVSFHSLPSYGQTLTGLGFLVPVKGPELFIAASVGSGSNTTLAVAGSTRAMGAAVARLANITSNRWLLETGNQAIIAGGTAGPFYIPPVAKRVRIASNMTASTQLVTLDAIRSSGAGPTTSRSVDLIGGGGWPGMVDLWMPTTGLELTMRNTSAGTLTWSAQAWDVSD